MGKLLKYLVQGGMPGIVWISALLAGPFHDQLQRPAAGFSGPESVHVGMTPGEVGEILVRPPQRICRQILHRCQIEQWQYDKPAPFCVQFVCLKGKDPFVLTVQESSPRKS
jgi:hypothetical protein